MRPPASSSRSPVSAPRAVRSLRRPWHRPAWLLLTLAVLACDPPAPPPPGGVASPDSAQQPPPAPASDVVLTVEYQSTGPGVPYALLLDNRSGEDIGYNLCTHVLERRVDNQWLQEGEGAICTLELRTLESGGTARYHSTFPVGLPEGDYRVRVGIQFMERNTFEPRVSETFRVGG
jgi:hypothetical protein